MGQPDDVYRWPIFGTIKEELDDLAKLIWREKRKVSLENERLMLRIEELERQYAKRKEV